MTVQEDVQQIIQNFLAQRKPMGFCCIAPVLAAKVLGKKNGGQGVELTLGMRKSPEQWPFNGAIAAAESLGNTLVEKDVDAVHVDRQNKVVSTPAYMKGTAAPHEVFDGIGALIKEVLALA